VDTAHGHSQGVLDAIRRIKSAWQGMPVIAGNVVTAEGWRHWFGRGDAVKVGVGAGSICTTRVIAERAAADERDLRMRPRCPPLGVPVIADGGVKYSGDIVKAIAAGRTR